MTFDEIVWAIMMAAVIVWGSLAAFTDPRDDDTTLDP